MIATPRSGNTWLRRLLATLGRLDEVAAFSPDGVDWEALPSRCALQVHWRRAEPFPASLGRHRFRVATIARHPLDILLSILHFAPHEPETARWLEGLGGDESSILGASPRSPAFLDYATGPRAQALLSVTPDWWAVPGCLRVSYERLVLDPVAELGRLAEALGFVASEEALAGAVAAHSLGSSRSTSRNHHYWQGRPGLWRLLLPAAEALRIAAAHGETFRALGYDCLPDPALDDAAADANWLAIRTRPS